MKTELTIEESARLIELGVKPKLASKKEFVDIHPEVLKGNAEYARPWGWMPSFTLSDLLSILPKEIKQAGRHPMTVVYYWCSAHKEWMVYYDYSHYDTKMKSAPELIDSLYHLLIWAIEQGHLKTEKK